MAPMARAMCEQLFAGRIRLRFGACVGCDESPAPMRLAVLPWTYYRIVFLEATDRQQQTLRGEIAASLHIAA